MIGEKNVDVEFDINSIKESLKKRKQFAINLDVASKIIELTNNVEMITGVNISHSDLMFSVLFNLEYEARHNIEIANSVIADAIRHKVMRKYIDKIKNAKEFFEFTIEIGRIAMLFENLLKYTEFDIANNHNEILELIDKFERVNKYKEFETAVVNALKNALIKQGYKDTFLITDLKTLKEYLQNIEKYKEEETEEKKKTLTLDEFLQMVDEKTKKEFDEFKKRIEAQKNEQKDGQQ